MYSDVLISIVVVDEDGPSQTIPRLAELSNNIAQCFRYYEVVYIISESQRAEVDAMAAMLGQLVNLRIILTRKGTSYYRQRLIGALEAIGDIVAIFDFDDMPASDFLAQVSDARNTEQIRIGWRSAYSSSSLLYWLLSLASNNLISARTSHSVIFPRQCLNAITSRKSASIDLRFELNHGSMPYHRFEVFSRAKNKSGLASRYELVLEILLAGAPRFLKWYSLAGFIVTAGSVFYGLYAIAIILLRSHVQEGWFSTAIVQSGGTAFLGAGMSILSIGLVSIIETLNGGNTPMIIDEISNTCFFDKTMDVNVEISGPEKATQ